METTGQTVRQVWFKFYEGPKDGDVVPGGDLWPEIRFPVCVGGTLNPKETDEFQKLPVAVYQKQGIIKSSDKIIAVYTFRGYEE